MKSLILASLLFAGPAAAQCTAFLVPPAARVTIDEYGNNVWQKERIEAIVAYPARSFISKHPVTIKHGGFGGYTQAACDPEGFVVSKAKGLLKVWVKKGNDDFETVWAKKDELVEVSYPYTYRDAGGNPHENLAAIDHAVLLYRDKVQSANFKAPEIENQQTFAADFDKVWTALVETLSDQQWPLETIDKASGLVTTKTMTDSRGETMACATKLDEAHRTSLNLFVKKVEDGVRVKVNATFRAVRDDVTIGCFSSGVIEKTIFDGIKKNL